jgi:L-glutamine-phosphate cytidylyltransferase
MVHGERPKCLIRVDGRTILDHQLHSLRIAGINDVGIVVGYQGDQIIRHLWDSRQDNMQTISFIQNPAFATTNNIYSLWLAREWLCGDSFVCLNADVVYDSYILRAALASKAPVSMIVDPEWRDETMKVIISGDRITQMSKQIPADRFSGTYIGITVFSEQGTEQLFGKLATLVQSGHVNDFFNIAVQQLADERVRVGFTSTSGLPWAEIDDPADLTFAQQNVFPRLAVETRL